MYLGMQTWPRHSAKVLTVSEMGKKGDLCESERETAADLLGFFPFFLTFLFLYWSVKHIKYPVSGSSLA